ncbi:MAG: AMP-binding protein [Lachnospiraceae bacterium]|nr:AMP-binding protein [Lachnospiraceae bacterium]
MKLSFSTSGWSNFTWSDFYTMCKDLGFDGIEIHNIEKEPFGEANSPLNMKNIAKTTAILADLDIKIPCIDSICNIADKLKKSENIETIKNYIKTAFMLNSPYIRVYAYETENASKDELENAAYLVIKETLPYAEESNITILIETMGIYNDTKALRELLNYFASNNLAALWDIHHPYRFNGESPEETIQNLGAYIKHVHLKDSEIENGKSVYRLMGEGDMPIKEIINSLRSINYEGFLSLEWQPDWLSELSDYGIVFPHFINYMASFIGSAKQKSNLYENKSGTGKYVWKKSILIDKTFSEVLDKMVAEFPDQYAFKYTTLDYTRTYTEFRDDVDTFARSLIALGVKSGDHVAVWATNVPEWYIAFWAVTKIGGVLVTMNTAYKIHEAEYLLRQSDTHTLIMIDGYRDSDYVSIIKELCPELETTDENKGLHSRRLPFLRNIITLSSRQKGCLTWDDVIKKSQNVPFEEVLRRAGEVDSHNVCNMQYTSGTTGFPKGVMLTHYNIVNNGKCIGDRMDLSTADRMMIQVPMFHCFGMVLAMTAAMTHGATLLPLPYFSPKPALSCINQERITCFHGVPTMFIALLEHEDFPKTDFSYMRTGIMAGSPCPISVMRNVIEKMNMTEITIVYGQTEASPGCTMSSSDDSIEVRVSTVGHPLPEIECKIIDTETGKEAPDGVTGEFVARGYNIMKGYYKMPKATEAAIDKDGWLHTGDLAARTPEGNFRITGRLKDMIIRGGENIYPKEIEEFIYTHPKVKDVQVIGIPDKQYGEEIMACVILKDGESITEKEMKKFVETHMAKHKVPKYVDFVSEFPMNVAGKILKYKMRQDAVKKLGLESAANIETA